MRFQIAPTSCRCGGSWAWMREVFPGTWEMIGCVCHHEPPTEVQGQELLVVPRRRVLQPRPRPDAHKTIEEDEASLNRYGYATQPKPTEPPMDGLAFQEMVAKHGGLQPNV